MQSHEQENLAEKRVTYTLQLDGQVFLLENVPARVNEESGEQLFAPSTVERLQQMILSQEAPDHFAKVPVYNYAT
ncbi:MAG: hypothetical protein MUC48_27735 [Leptolyngbya sp. Prado105]|nr:hypothetical protein [Leptolyngbya sp. Prado105]